MVAWSVACLKIIIKKNIKEKIKHKFTDEKRGCLLILDFLS